MGWLNFKYVMFSFTLHSLLCGSVAAVQPAACRRKAAEARPLRSSRSPAFSNPAKVWLLIKVSVINLVDVYIYCSGTAGMFPFPADIEA